MPRLLLSERHTSMNSPAKVISPAERIYSGGPIRPERWATWVPNKGDILVCTPPKCGTTWTQTMLAMLVHGGAELPGKLPEFSPWVDADLGVPANEVAEALTAQKGRRVVKTHTPADGLPIWEGVTVIAVYRHPLDVFFPRGSRWITFPTSAMTTCINGPSRARSGLMSASSQIATTLAKRLSCLWRYTIRKRCFPAGCLI